MDLESRVKRLEGWYRTLAQGVSAYKNTQKHYLKKRLPMRQRAIYMRLVRQYNSLAALERRLRGRLGSFKANRRVTRERRFLMMLTNQERQYLRYLLKRKREFRKRKEG